MPAGPRGSKLSLEGVRMGLVTDRVKRTPSASHDFYEGKILAIGEDVGVIGTSMRTLGEVSVEYTKV